MTWQEIQSLHGWAALSTFVIRSLNRRDVIMRRWKCFMFTIAPLSNSIDIAIKNLRLCILKVAGRGRVDALVVLQRNLLG